MSKLFLSVGVLAFGLMSVGGAQAALRVEDASAMSLTSTTSVPTPSCATCGLSRMPRSGETTMSNPQPLPPKTYGGGRMLRR
jgi:hypothetical protein